MNTCNCKECGIKLQSNVLSEFMSYYEEGYFCHSHKKWLSQEDRNVVFDTQQRVDYPQMSKSAYVGCLLYFAYKHNLVEYLKLLNGLAQLLPHKSQIDGIINSGKDSKITKHSNCLKYIISINKDNIINLFTDRKNIIKSMREINPVGDTNNTYRLIGNLLRQKHDMELFPFQYVLQSKVKEFMNNNKNRVKEIGSDYIKIDSLASEPEITYIIKESYKDRLNPIICSIPFKIKGKTGKTQIFVLDDYVIRKLFILDFTEFKDCLAFIQQYSQ